MLIVNAHVRKLDLGRGHLWGRRALLLVLGLLATACSKSADEQGSKQRPERSSEPPTQHLSSAGLVGKWCFKPSTLEATWELIAISKDGRYSVVEDYGDGSSRTHSLTESSDGLRDDDSDTGDRFVLPSTAGGELVVADADGEIGRASALPFSANPADCFQS